MAPAAVSPAGEAAAPISPLFLHYGVAFLIRAFVAANLAGPFDLTSRPEVATPVTGHSRLVEGADLLDRGMDPYSGVLCHEPPLLLHAFAWARNSLPRARLDALYPALDMLTAMVIGALAAEAARTASKRRKGGKYHRDAEDLLEGEAEAAAEASKRAQVLYLFNPFTLLNCAAKTSTGVDNLLLSFFLLFLARKRILPATLFLALAAYKGFYPVMLAVPLVIALSQDAFDGRAGLSFARLFFRAALPVFALTSALVGLLLYASYVVMGRSGTFLWATYGFVLSVPELSPNMGLFWYFFTEMFEHFRVFFVCTFQLNAFVYVFPLAIRLRREPLLLSFVLVALTAIFKSYPSYGDVGFYLSLLPLFSHLLPYTKQLFVVACMFLASGALGPILYRLWIYNGSANANYFFAINLVFGTAQIFLVTDLLFGHIKREFYLENGYKELRAGQEKPNGPKLTLK